MYYLINVDTCRVEGSSQNKSKLVEALEALVSKRSVWNTYVIAERVLESRVKRELN